MISIGSNAFERCTGLESLTLPESIQYIGEDIFIGDKYFNPEYRGENFKTVYYGGSPKTAEKIIIEEGNVFLKTANWVYAKQDTADSPYTRSE